MMQRRGVLALLVVVAFVRLRSALFAQNKDDKKKDEAQKKEIQSIVKIVDDAAAGQPAPNDLALDVAARGCAEGAGQQGIRAVHRHARSRRR